jgi:two-component system chemotaxis sensor kinase CheA
MEGKETELDKTLLEAIKDPLTHVVRNAVDHGIESPEVRMAHGKSAEGCLCLRAFHEGGKVNIEVHDDGAGIDPERIKAKALERGLIRQEEAARLSDRDCLQLIFLPGFSTAEKISNISGRGVGMDVVKTNIERIGGSVDIQSQPGKGAVLKFKIPLTLAIIPALIVCSGGDRYAIPQASLLELVRLDSDEARTGIERIHGAPVYRLRGQLLPLVCLDHLLRTTKSRNPETALHSVVLQVEDRRFGLLVEEINDTEEIVVKPLGKPFKNIPLFAGATIMGDGRVALILDVHGIAQQAGVISDLRDRSWRRQPRSRRDAAAANNCCCSWAWVRSNVWPCRWRRLRVSKRFLPQPSRKQTATRSCNTVARSYRSTASQI